MSAYELIAVVTGFEPFDGGATNASWLAVKELPDTLPIPGGLLHLITEQLPVTFAGAAARSRALITEHEPDIIIHVGLNAKAPGVMLETTAYNLQKASIPDNAGHLATGEEVVPGGEYVRHSTWVAPVLAGRLTGRGLPVQVSDDAGRYVCNTTLYTAVDAIRDLPGARHAGFVHVPGSEVIPTATVTASLVALLGELAEHLLRQRAHGAGMSRLSVPRGTRPLRVAVTGGIGSGKSTVCALLAERGAGVVDADRVAREVMELGSPLLAEIAKEFGTEMLTPDGSLDRQALAHRVFSDAAARLRLDALTLPRIGFEAARQMETLEPPVTVYDIPLLTEERAASLYDYVVSVEAPVDVRVARLVERGLTQADAQARIAAQISDEERAALADAVLTNAGSREDLASQVAALWEQLIETSAA